MALALRMVFEIVLALLRARNRKGGGEDLENIAQASAASGDDRLLKVNSTCTTEHKPTCPANEASELNECPAPNAGRLRAIEFATQLGFGTRADQRPEDTRKGVNDPRQGLLQHIDLVRILSGELLYFAGIRTRRNWQGIAQAVSDVGIVT